MTTIIVGYDGRGNPEQLHQRACMGRYQEVRPYKYFIYEMQSRIGPNDYVVGYFAGDSEDVQGYRKMRVEQAKLFADAVNDVLVRTKSPLRCQCYEVDTLPIYDQEDEEDDEPELIDEKAGAVLELRGDLKLQEILLFSYLARWWTEHEDFKRVKCLTKEGLLAAMFHQPPKGWGGGVVMPRLGHHITTAIQEPVSENNKRSVHHAAYWTKTPKRALIDWPQEALRRIFDRNFKPQCTGVKNGDTISMEDVYQTDWEHIKATRTWQAGVGEGRPNPRGNPGLTASIRLKENLNDDFVSHKRNLAPRKTWEELLNNGNTDI